MQIPPLSLTFTRLLGIFILIIFSSFSSVCQHAHHSKFTCHAFSWTGRGRGKHHERQSHFYKSQLALSESRTFLLGTTRITASLRKFHTVSTQEATTAKYATDMTTRPTIGVTTISREKDKITTAAATTDATATGIHINKNIHTNFSTNANTREHLPVLQPLSFHPLLFTSAEPILSESQCTTLQSWIQANTSQAQKPLDQTLFQRAIEEKEEGALILQSLQKTIASLLAEEEGCENSHVLPRYLTYTSMATPASTTKELGEYTVHDLLPDGLHVDTNNAKHFRHWTVLLNLECTYDVLGATNFPLAMPLNHDGDECECDYDGRFPEQIIAEKLIVEQDVQHTRLEGATELELEMGSFVENAALDLMLGSKSGEAASRVRNMGVRVMPKRGHICTFSGLKGDGYPNPLSFHGGEAMFKGESKEVLSFFFEVPLDSFLSRKELGEMVRQREERFLDLHGFQHARR